MSETRLPPAFADLERFASKWCLASEPERYAERMASSMEEMQEFYDACFPRVEEAIDYCDKFPLDDLPDDALHLLYLIYSLIMVSMPVDVWHHVAAKRSRSAKADGSSGALIGPARSRSRGRCRGSRRPSRPRPCGSGGR